MKILKSENMIPDFSRFILLVAVLVLPGLALADPEEDYKLGVEAYRIGDVVTAMAPLRRAADAGLASAQALYGTILDSAGVDEEAVSYLRKAAEQNDPDGQYGLAKMYMTGEGVEATDDAQASQLLRAAAAQEHEPSIIALASAYIGGSTRLDAGDPTHPEAAPLLLRAAEIGDVSAMAALVKAYQDGGFGIQPDAAKAEAWADRVAEIRGVPKNAERAR